MSNLSGDGGSFSSGNTREEDQQLLHQTHFNGSNSGATAPDSSGSTSQQPHIKKKRNLPGNPDPSAEVIALSPTTLMATNRFVCEICNKGFQRDQNLQLHRRGHNLPWKLRQRTTAEIRKRVYICPITTCVHHNPSRALGDLTGIKKHYCRKHGEKKWKCDKCSKKYAVQSDWKAHIKTCGTKEYKCDCGTIFSRRDSFITHRAFCDALTEENNKANQGLMPTMEGNLQSHVPELMTSFPSNNSASNPISDFNREGKNPLKSFSHDPMSMQLKPLNMEGGSMFSNHLFGPRNFSSLSLEGLIDNKHGAQMVNTAHTSATALLQKAAQMGATASSNMGPPMLQRGFAGVVGSSDSGFSNQFMHKDPPDMSHFFHSTTAESAAAMNDMGMFSTAALGLYMSGDQDHDFLKNIEHESSNSSGGNLLHHDSRNAHLGLGGSRFGGRGSGDPMTVDFMGVGGPRAANLHEQQQHHHHHQQQGLGFEGVGQQRLHGLHQLQEHLPHGQVELEKPMWNV
ncbi:hypothetical protein AAC387_Pa03g2107 [Persea americana]